MQSHLFNFFIKTVGIFFIYLFCFLIVLEIALRYEYGKKSNFGTVLSENYVEKIHDHFYFDENGLFLIEPNSEGEHIGFSRPPVWIKINSDGFRGPEIRPNVKQKVIITGDSIVFDGGNEQADTAVELLENKFVNEGYDVEIINGGTTDVGIDQYLLQAKYGRLSRFKPDLIVIGLYLNDARPPQGFVGESESAFLKTLDLPIINKTYIANFLTALYIKYSYATDKKVNLSTRFSWVERWKSQKWLADLDEFKKTVVEAQYDWGDAWNNSFQDIVYPKILEIKKIYEDQGIKFAVILFPVDLQIYTQLSDSFIIKSQIEFKEFAAINNIFFLDLLPRLKELNDKKLFVDHCHLTKQGDLAVADALYPFIKSIIIKK